MRWKTKKPDMPNGGDKRELRRFAWKPTEVGQHTVWLELYGIEETFFQPASGSPGWWSERKRYALDWYY